jgi:hypothetical protein
MFDSELVQKLSELDRLTAEVAALVGRFERSGEWAAEGATSVVAWLRGQGLSGGDAGRLAGLGRRLERLPVLAEAWLRGAITGGQVQAVLSAVPERRLALFAEHEAAVVPTLVGLDVADTARVMREWAAWADALDDGFVGGEPVREVRLSRTLGNRFVLNGDLDAEGGAVVERALSLADSGDYSVPAARRRGDALVDVARFFLGNQRHRRAGRHRPHVSVLVDAASVAVGAELPEHDVRVDAATTSRLLCDCSLSRAVVERLEGGRPAVLDYGTSTRTIPAPLWAALVVRDRRCRFPGCDRPPSWCEGHHVRWFSRGGPTALDNLVLLCTRHHHLLHAQSEFEAKLLPDGTFNVTLPNGTVRTTGPPPLAAAAVAVDSVFGEGACAQSRHDDPGGNALGPAGPRHVGARPQPLPGRDDPDRPVAAGRVRHRDAALVRRAGHAGRHGRDGLLQRLPLHPSAAADLARPGHDQAPADPGAVAGRAPPP